MAGKSLFDKRTQTWESRLFLDVPRMDPLDERYQGIKAKRFVGAPAPEERMPELGAQWIDPLQEGEEDEEAPPDTQREPLVELPLDDAMDPTDPAPPPDQFQPIMNQGRVLAGAPTKPAQTDPWEPKKKPAPTNEVVIPSGAQVRLGSPGVDPK